MPPISRLKGRILPERNFSSADSFSSQAGRCVAGTDRTAVGLGLRLSSNESMKGAIMAWWLVTWSTYGSWLPGDPRGFQTRRGKEYIPPPKRYAKPGEPTYNPAEYSDRYQSAKALASAPVKLAQVQRKCALNAVVGQLTKLSVVPAALAVSSEHSHLLAKFGSLKIRTTAGVLKGEATKALHQAGFNEEQIWSAECHMKSKKEGREFQIALRYVANHLNEGAELFIWPDFRDFLR
jgi:hypothetical protein